MSKKSQDELKSMESVAGVYLAVTSLLTAAVRKCGGSFEDVRRLTTPEGADTIEKIADLVAAVTKFAVINYFVWNPTVKFSDLGDDFQRWFYGKTEKMKSVTVPRLYYDLRKASLDCEILADIGSEDDAETTMAGIYELLKLQANGKAGALINNGYENIFYVCDANSVLRAVFVCWRADGWCVAARSVNHSDGWNIGDRVFSY